MQMRFKLARSITIDGFVAESVPTSASIAHVVLDDWVADLAGNQPTTGHNLRVRFLDVSGAELLGGSVTLQVFRKTAEGFWVSDSVVVCVGTECYSSTLTGELFVSVASIVVTDIPTAVVVQILVEEI